VDTIPLADGDVGWVFPELDDAGEVLDLLRRADSEIRLLADHLGVRASWTGSGIEFHRLECGQASLFGCAETDDVSFIVELWVPHNRASDLQLGPSWEVDGEISVRCDAPADCGMHSIEEAAPRQFDTPLGAALALLEVATWLRQRGVAESSRSSRRVIRAEVTPETR
jgi:hypothetical protein